MRHRIALALFLLIATTIAACMTAPERGDPKTQAAEKESNAADTATARVKPTGRAAAAVARGEEFSPCDLLTDEDLAEMGWVRDEYQPPAQDPGHKPCFFNIDIVDAVYLETDRHSWEEIKNKVTPEPDVKSAKLPTVNTFYWDAESPEYCAATIDTEYGRLGLSIWGSETEKKTVCKEAVSGLEFVYEKLFEEEEE